MPNNMDGVKISVNNSNDELNEPTQVKKRKIVRKKAPVSSQPVREESEREEDEEKQLPSLRKNSSSKSGSIAQTLISIGITAVVVGAIVYFWQTSVVNEKVDQAKQESINEKSEFENTLANIKSKLTGTETEKVELSKTLEDLKKKAALLVDAKKEYVNDEMGFSFDYPVVFGLVSKASSTVASGTMNSFSFEGNPKLIFGGVSQDYKASVASGSPELFEAKGFIEKDKKIFVVGQGAGKEYEVVPAKTIEFKGGKAILIDKKSFVSVKAGESLPFNIGENVAVVLNLRSKKYSGLSFVNSDFGALPLDGFLKLIGSIQIK